MYAHASGFNWDEALIVIAPIAAVGALLLWARRRDTRPVPASSAEESSGDHTR